MEPRHRVVAWLARVARSAAVEADTNLHSALHDDIELVSVVSLLEYYVILAEPFELNNPELRE